MIKKKAHKRSKMAVDSRWFSSDAWMAEIVCILLVVILVIGAFLAPKMINSLYDAGTLAQIEYMDMNLNTYEVAYSNFEEKLKAIGLIKAYGEEFSILPVEETSKSISDEDLTELVNQEIGKLIETDGFLYDDGGWWSSLTEKNLILREKETLYVQHRIGTQENDTLQDMPPIEVWALTYEMTEAQEQMWIKENVEEAEAMTMAEGVTDTSVDLSVVEYNLGSVPKHLTVILDAEFYKIYAAALSGASASAYIDKYDFPIWELIGDQYIDVAKNAVAQQMDIERQIAISWDASYRIAEAWSDYWGIKPDGRNEYTLDQGLGNLMTGMIIRYDTEDREDTVEVSFDVGCQIVPDNPTGSEEKRKHTQKYGLRDFFEMIQF